MFTPYEPESEYVACLLAAGWITLEEIDPDYIEYRKNATEPVSHARWTELSAEYQVLNKEYDEIREHCLFVEPHSNSPEIKAAVDRIVSRWLEIEWELEL